MGKTSGRTVEWTCPVCGMPNETAGKSQPKCVYCGFVVEKFGAGGAPAEKGEKRRRPQTKKAKETRLSTPGALLITAIIALVLVGIYISAHQPSEPSPGGAEEVEILNTRSYTSEWYGTRYYTVVGEVKNNTSKEIKITIVANFYDEKGEFLDSHSQTVPAYFNTGVLPGEKHPFKLMSKYKASQHELNVSYWKPFITLPRGELEIIKVENQIIGDTYYVEGEIKNVGPGGCWPYGVITFYDTEGKVFGYSLIRFAESYLSPGQITTFGPLGSAATEVSDYAILVWSTKSL